MREITIRRLAVSDAEDYRTIRLAALKADPEAFGSTYDAEVERPLEHFAERLAGTTVFGAYQGRDIVGMVGFKREDGQKSCHKGFVWGMFVRAAARGRGIGAALMGALIPCAAETVEQLTLTVVEGNEAAIALYRKFGFERYGVEPRSLKSAAGYVNEVLMARVLDR